VYSRGCWPAWHRHAEARSIVHRDLKPENLMVADDGTIKIADFGIVRRSADPSRSTSPRRGRRWDAHYMAPEQAMGEPIGPGTDLYATGAIAYRLFTGRTAVRQLGDADGGAAAPRQRAGRAADRARSGARPRISDWIMRMLAETPRGSSGRRRGGLGGLEDIALDLLSPGGGGKRALAAGRRRRQRSASPTASVVPVPVAPTITGGRPRR
jgi:serine/threonine-protein kinase